MFNKNLKYLDMQKRLLQLQKIKLLQINFIKNIEKQKKIYKNNLNLQKIEKSSILNNIIPSDKNVDNIKKIYIVSNIKGGGSLKYLNDIINHYKDVSFVYIRNKKSLINTLFLPYDILFVQHLLFTDIVPKDLTFIKNKYNIKIIISIHDFYWFIPYKNELEFKKILFNAEDTYYEKAYLNPPITIHKDIIQLFNDASLVIHPSSFTKIHYNKMFPINNAIIQQHNDLKIDYNTKTIPKIINNNINIGNFQALSICKGSEFISLLKNKYNIYKGYKINFLTVGDNIDNYTENNWYNDIIKYNFHCLLHLNKYGETYSYCLTKSINSGLPILYNNIGSFKERIPKDKDHYIQVYKSENNMSNNNLLYEKFENILDYIISNNGKFNISNYNNTNDYKDLYNYIFNENITTLSINSIIHNKIKPFAVYFPQFHSITENNKNYYEGMTDIVNLDHYIKNYKKPDEIIDTPSLTELPINNILEYNLTNKQIIIKQIEIAKKFSIYGFACYYYWFSDNLITNKNTIFENCYNLFFEEELSDFKIYFIWANEDWSNNLSFNTTEIIVNKYNSENFIKNINNLIKYFKHPNYYKIENKPVFYIHHPWFINENMLLLFKNMLDSECIKNGFDGIILSINNMKNNNLKHLSYNFTPSRKKDESKDYNIYTNTVVANQQLNNSPNTIFFDFNNSARFTIPYRSGCVTIFNNNTINNQDKLVKLNFNKYKKKNINETNKILLINSWNEWGENMAIEPGEINKTKYLSLIKSNLLSFISY